MRKATDWSSEDHIIEDEGTDDIQSLQSSVYTLRQRRGKKYSQENEFTEDNSINVEKYECVGLTMAKAREILCDSISHAIEEKEHSTDLTQEFRDHFLWLLVFCGVLRYIHYFYQGQERIELLEGTFLLGAAFANVLLNITQQRRHRFEIAERVRFAVETLRSHTVRLSAKVLEDMNETKKKTKNALLPSTCYVACYRNEEWHRMPMNLLVEGDVVALMSGDVAPGDVCLIDDQPKKITLTCKRGSKIPSDGGGSQDIMRCNATFNSKLLLSLCGEMRIFKMLETPVLQDVHNALFEINRPETRTQKLLVKVRSVAMHVCAAYMLVTVLAISMRNIFQRQSLTTTLDHLLLAPACIGLCFASLNTPFVIFIAEAAATSSILGSFERTVAPGDQTNCAHTVTVSSTVDTDQGKEKIEVQMSSLLGRNKSEYVETDIFDVEERERLRHELSLQVSSLIRSLQYFGVALKFRLMSTNLAHLTSYSDSGLPVPFRSLRLLERLGSTTMLCCFDDDILCESKPSVEEIILLGEKQGNSIVLDLHHERNCSTGIKFEDPKWSQHLPLLKPIGLGILLSDAKNPIDQYHATLKYLENESLCSKDSTGEYGTNPLLRTCIQHLAAHIRMVSFPKHLLNLSKEIGFVDSDVQGFQRQQTIHVISPRLAHQEHTIDLHDQGQEDTRYRGNLQSHLYSTVVLDKRVNRHQLLSRGHPSIVLNQCTEYWDGKSICPLTTDKRRLILDMHKKWCAEDLDCVALSYAPVAHKMSALFSTRHRHGEKLKWDLSADGLLPPVYFVEDSSVGDQANQLSEINNARHQYRSGKPIFYPHRQSISPQTTFSIDKFRSTISPASRSRNVKTMSDGVPSSAGNLASEVGSIERNAMMWKVQEDQIFLGMLATGVQPKETVPEFIEDLTACGIRFVYFSPRNMRRSKLLGEKMGIVTDWNCAISLRQLEADRPDPNRIIGLSDWDVKARLPHGVEAIKKHLEEVDNVPLLVSLYTDSTPDTISEMISVFQQHEEVVMGIGSSLKETNAPLFSRADSAIAIQNNINVFFDEKLPSSKIFMPNEDIPCLTEEDIQFSRTLNTLTCSFQLKTDTSIPEHTPLPEIIELIRLGRRMLTNFHQLLTFIFVSQLFLATVITLAYVAPFSVVPQLSCISLCWFLWILVPVISLCMLATPSEAGVMKTTPRKNEEVEISESFLRLSTYFILRHVPSAVIAILLFQWTYHQSLNAALASMNQTVSNQDNSYVNNSIVTSVVDTTLSVYGAADHPFAKDTAIDRAEAIMTLQLGLSLLASSVGYLYRTESIFVVSPLRNRIWVGTCCVLLLLHLILSVVRVDYVGMDGTLISDVVHLPMLLLILIWPVVVILIDDSVKCHDRHHLARYYKFLRMQFDTRLGMYSPK